VALNAGIMLRECTKHESLTKILLNSDNFYRFFDYVELSTFDVASDAFTTFRVRGGAAGRHLRAGPWLALTRLRGVMGGRSC
jgi:hypothetical protein